MLPVLCINKNNVNAVSIKINNRQFNF